MTRGRTSLPQGLLASFVAATTVWLTMLTWRPLTEDASSFVGPLFLGMVVLAVSGSLLRWAQLPAVVVLGLQSLVGAGLVLVSVTGSLLPSTDNLAALGAAMVDGIESAGHYRSPVPADVPPVTPLFVLAGFASMVVMDLVAITLGRVAASGLLLMTLYSVPVSVTLEGVDWWLFALVSGGFLLLLFLHQDQLVTRWGRGVPGRDEQGDPGGFGVRTGAVRSSALAIGAGTTALALVVPVFVPTLGLDLWDGPGTGRGGNGISIDNPLVDLRRDLQRGDDVPLLRVSSEGDRPTYVRLSVLNRFSSEEWSSGDRNVPTDQVADGEMPPLVGVGQALSRSESSYTFEGTPGFRSQWLPTMPLVSAVQANGDWRYDRSTMDFLAGDEDLSTAGQQWSVRGVRLEYDAKTLDAASSGAGQVGSELVQVPANLPTIVRSLTESVAGSEPTRFRQARALQDWFRTEFDYSLERVDNVGTSELAAFLDPGNREGYCEQFAAAMAVMARVLEIPARVAIGFLEPEQIGPETWEFSSDDLHAWPELFFPGSGWVRFEPTPPSRASGVPDYTQVDLPEVEETSRPDVPRASEDLPDRESGPEEEATEDEAADDEAAGGLPWGRIGGAAAVLALLLAAALAPRLVRTRRRERRVSSGDIEALWDELRDEAVDLGRRWPAGRSPRVAGEQVGRWLGARDGSTGVQRPAVGPDQDPGATAALGRLVGALERSRYGRPGGTAERDPAWVEDLQACVGALAAGVGPRVRRRARWLPGSVLGRRPSGTGGTEVVRSRAGLVDHIG